MIDIYVGESRRHWSLHRNLLCYHSTFFETELEGTPSKKLEKNKKLELLEEDPAAFELLVKWLYQGKIDDVSAMPMDRKWDYADCCQKLYILCNRIHLPQLMNLAIDQFRKGCNEAGLVPGPEEMKPIYEKTPVRSPFRKLMSQIAARQIMDPDSEKDAGAYRSCFEGNPDFAVDVINAIRSNSGGKLFEDPTEGEPCRFHEHENGQTCRDNPKLRKAANFTNGAKRAQSATKPVSPRAETSTNAESSGTSGTIMAS